MWITTPVKLLLKNVNLIMTNGQTKASLKSTISATNTDPNFQPSSKTFLSTSIPELKSVSSEEPVVESQP